MKRRPRHVSKEEKALWREVTKHDTPMHPARPNLPEPERPAPKPVRKPRLHQPEVPAPLAAFRIGAEAKPNAPGDDLLPTLSRRLSEAPVHMDQKAYGRLRRGKLAPERRIDLHGMTLDQAHPALLRFITSSHARGLRLVLVITGKGKRGEDEGPIPRPRGVLKHQVPQWLRAAPLGPLILQVTEAHIRHGGAGAYYVYLKRHR
ncbi:Smr/MutS family protein [Pseudoruegeria sp. SHC-113]|uniref:Smr/MutS family protein n=1 Tax=Pseudoruegeria sp. SHC-113 TaxID=2855439 RepID=UPI0021BACF38|nr:Smr/MutS family protein [Pseudoruegeria sp. SHC-113]MCT8158589.1 Smr/MutS family protein [Pseudoruegeria sp. SHC-113]